jgi:hypothetical protein
MLHTSACREERQQVEQEQNPRARSFIKELVPRWPLTRPQVLWAIRITVAVVLTLTVVAILGDVLWWVMGLYIDPKTAQERKDLVQSYAIVVAGVVGSVSALVAVGNLYISRRNLQQQRELEVHQGQDDALRAYLDQMIKLLLEYDLGSSGSEEDVSAEDRAARSVARAQTLSVLSILDGHRKYGVLLFLVESALIFKERHIVWLVGADLSNLKVRSSANLRWNLRGIVLHGTDLSGADLHNVVLRESFLSHTDLSGADLSYADLTGADLNDADLTRANLTHALGVSKKQLTECLSLAGTTMPNGQKYEEWRKSREGRGEDGENSASS